MQLNPSGGESFGFFGIVLGVEQVGFSRISQLESWFKWRFGLKFTKKWGVHDQSLIGWRVSSDA